MNEIQTGQTLRWVIAIAMFLVGGFFLLSSWGALGNLFEEYQDSPASTYLLFGGIQVAIGIVCFGLGFAALLYRSK